MEFTIALLVTGLFILLFTMFRLRKYRQHQELQNKLSNTYDITSLDLSGNTQYASCFSHEWVMKNITNKSHSRLGSALQDYLADSTLIAGMWIGFTIFISSVLLTLLFVESLRAIGSIIFVFLVGVLVAVGPGEPRYAEDLLDAVQENEIKELNAQDFVYVKIANETIKHFAILNIIIAVLLITISPWGDMLPSLLAQGIALFTAKIIWEPALLLLEYNVGFALFYIAGIIGISSFLCFKIGQRIISPEEEAPRVQY